ncbi:MAG: glutamine synthetase [Rhodospirillales bacterium]|jgi:glutamine synthetase|nr:glutamine synthetase [Rhodospirillales bacterium]
MTVSTKTEAEFLSSLDCTHVRVGVVDLDGVIRGKYLAKEKFLSVLEGGSAFCSVIFGWDSNDTLYNNDYTGWANGYPDDQVRVVVESRRVLPESKTPFYLMEFTGRGTQICPRSLAGRVLERAKSSGFSVKAGFEYEFYGFDETPESAREKHNCDLVPMTVSTGGYSIIRSSVYEEFFEGLLELSEQLKTPIEGLHPEAGKGALEYALCPSDGIEAADRAAIFKTFSKIWGQRHGVMLCYMAKPNVNLPGCGGHLHLSLSREGEPAFFDSTRDDNLSDVARYFIAGQQKFMPEVLAMTAPTVNSFTRLTPGYWAPTASNWGFDNRTCSLRVVGDSPKSLRVEYRVTSADANPYLVFAAAIASGLAGIEAAMEPEPPTSGNAYEVEHPDEMRFPSTLGAAAARLRASHMARDWFGDEFVDHFATSREFEETEYRAHVSDWEMSRYFEMI